MGLLVNGQWHDQWYNTQDSAGEFIREDAQYRHWVTPDGATGLSGEGGFIAEPNRYHLYVSLACPWAHRTLIFRELKQLQDTITISVVHPDMLTQGWQFTQDFAAATGDTLYDYDYLHQLYTRDNAQYSGRVTVPVLWDKQQQSIVSNESSDIIRMMNSAFNHLTNNHDDYYPKAQREEINAINAVIYDTINNGVYRAGFATQAPAYEKAVTTLFASLDKIDQRLAHQ
jgi:putative glutathione S-transferase